MLDNLLLNQLEVLHRRITRAAYKNFPSLHSQQVVKIDGECRLLVKTLGDEPDLQLYAVELRFGDIVEGSLIHAVFSPDAELRFEVTPEGSSIHAVFSHDDEDSADTARGDVHHSPQEQGSPYQTGNDSSAAPTLCFVPEYLEIEEGSIGRVDFLLQQQSHDQGNLQVRKRFRQLIEQAM